MNLRFTKEELGYTGNIKVVDYLPEPGPGFKAMMARKREEVLIMIVKYGLPKNMPDPRITHPHLFKNYL